MAGESGNNTETDKKVSEDKEDVGEKNEWKSSGWAGRRIGNKDIFD